VPPASVAKVAKAGATKTVDVSSSDNVAARVKPDIDTPSK
jgi:hypothetical protein